MKILLADDHLLFMGGFSLILKNLIPDCVITQVDSWVAANAAVKEASFDLTILDLFMPSSGSNWSEALSRVIDGQESGVVCVISSSTNKNDMHTAFELGVRGYIHKSSNLNEIRRAMNLMMKGKTYFPWQMKQNIHFRPSSNSKLTARQHEILSMMAEGQRNGEIAIKLNIMESTAKRHVYNICQQLEVKSRTEAVYQARQRGLLSY